MWTCVLFVTRGLLAGLPGGAGLPTSTKVFYTLSPGRAPVYSWRLKSKSIGMNLPLLKNITAVVGLCPSYYYPDDRLRATPDSYDSLILPDRNCRSTEGHIRSWRSRGLYGMQLNTLELVHIRVLKSEMYYRAAIRRVFRRRWALLPPITRIVWGFRSSAG